MPWTASLLRPFQNIADNPGGTDFHGPYNKLLHALFPPESQYTVVPEFVPGSRGEAIDFVVSRCFDEGSSEVFLLALRPPGELQYGSKRQDADLHIRRRIEDMKPYCPLPVLHAVSAFGTQLCFYSMPHNGHVKPPLITAHPQSVTNTAPWERWDCDILEEKGEQKLRTVVEEVQQRDDVCRPQ